MRLKLLFLAFLAWFALGGYSQLAWAFVGFEATTQELMLWLASL